jgi:hypothetical protein
MTKYLLDYRGGCKGDFLCNFINYNKIIYDNDYRKSKTPNLSLKIDIEQVPTSRIEKTLQQDISIIAGHNLQKLHCDLLLKYNVKILKINLEEKFYKTAAIESLIKNSKNSIGKLNSFLLKKINKSFKDNSYYIDYTLIKNQIEITDENRHESLLSLLNNIENEFDSYYELKPDYPTLYKNINYEDIYLNKKYDALYEIKQNFDSVLYEELLEKTWLPDIVNLFGYDIDLKKYGYRVY